MNSNSTSVGPSDFQGLHRLAWEARFRDPSAIGAIAQRMADCSAAGSVELAWAHLHRAVAFRFIRDSASMQMAIADAEALFRANGFEPGIAMCREQKARLLANTGDEGAARSLADANSPELRGRLNVWEQFALADLDVVIATRFSTPEATIRVLSKAIVAARATGDSAAIAQTQSMLAGKHAELNNYETALTLGLEAYQLAAAVKPGAAWYISGLNLLLIHNGMGNAQEALLLTQALSPFDETFFQPIREQSNLLYARAYLLNNDPQAAQVALDRSRAFVAVQTQTHSWTSAQANVFLATHEASRAKKLCTEWIEKTPRAEKGLYPSAALRIYRTAAQASESTGDLRAALDFEREAAIYSEIELGRAALARRVALEIEFDFDRERAARDEADKKRVESEIERARLDELNRQLDAALQTRTRFLAAASHDLRQPAHALALYAAALEHETSRPALVDISSRMRATVGSLSNMFDGLLELARLDADAVKPQHESFDLTELLTRLCTEYADRLIHPNAMLKLRRMRTECFVRSDAVLVERVLRNLMGNAVKYAGEGAILVALRRRASSLDIEVRDSGPGMSAEELRHIFDEFFRARSANNRRDGLGLGLAIVERFARLLDMQIAVRSRMGCGTTFVVRIPITLLTSAPEAQALAMSRNVPSTALRVVVIDDDEDARNAMARLLAKWGHQCFAAESAQEAITKHIEHDVRPDVVVSDFQLRDGDAIDGIVQMRQRWGADLPVLVVSGSHLAQEAVEARFSDVSFLAKPVRPLRLKSWLAASAASPASARRD